MAAGSRRWSELSRQILRNELILRRYVEKQWIACLHEQPQRQKATAAQFAHPLSETDLPPVATTRPEEDPCYKHIDLTFENSREAFKSKTNGDLIRALTVFNLCSIKPLVDYNKQLMRISRKVLGKTLFKKVMKSSFYGQFVAGEDVDGIRPTIARNRMFGVKSILDYSVEKDISREEAQAAEMNSCVSDAQPKDIEHSVSNVRFRAHRQFGDRREAVYSARTYFYKDEAQCDINMQNFLNGIDAVSGATNATGFAAVKLTALGRPQLLLQLSEVVSSMRRFYDVLAAQGGHDTIMQKDFERYLKRINISREERKQWYSIVDVTQDGEIDLLDWHHLRMNLKLARVLRVPNIEKCGDDWDTTGELVPLMTGWTDKEADQMRNMLHRIDTVVQYGKEKDVRVMIDAEQTYFQVAIGRLCVEMMRKYNKDKSIVFNTYQCYLKDAFATITTDLALAKREKFYFGAKLVRGAYMEQERQRAATLGYDDPINPSFDATTEMYQRVLSEVMKQIIAGERGLIALMVASHNEDTIRSTVKKMKEYGIHASDKVICFGQLLGMCDHVSFPLGQAGYSVYKYVPYGPVEEVLPYLSRRSMENRGILEKVQKEKRLLWGELKNRWLAGKFMYTPPVQDSPLDFPPK